MKYIPYYSMHRLATRRSIRRYDLPEARRSKPFHAPEPPPPEPTEQEDAQSEQAPKAEPDDSDTDSEPESDGEESDDDGADEAPDEDGDQDADSDADGDSGDDADLDDDADEDQDSDDELEDDGDDEPGDNDFEPDDEGEDEALEPDQDGDEAALGGEEEADEEAIAEPEYVPFAASYDYNEPEPEVINGVKHRHFDTVGGLSAWCEKLGRPLLEGTGNLRTRWGGAGTLKGLDYLLDGDETYAEEAQRLMEKFLESVEVPAYTWKHDIAGVLPDVPAYLSGDPECMWTKYPVESESTPLRVWVGVAASTQIPDELIRKRGITLAAFAMAMLNKRPVYITPFLNNHETYSGDGGTHSIISWDIQTSPLVLSQLLASLTQPYVTRYLGTALTYIELPDMMQGGPFALTTREHNRFCTPEDLYLPQLQYDDPMLKDPVTWIKTQVEKYGGEE